MNCLIQYLRSLLTVMQLKLTVRNQSKGHSSLQIFEKNAEKRMLLHCPTKNSLTPKTVKNLQILKTKSSLLNLLNLLHYFLPARIIRCRKTDWVELIHLIYSVPSLFAYFFISEYTYSQRLKGSDMTIFQS